MNQTTFPKIIMCLAIILFVFELLSLNFNHLGKSIQVNYLKFLVPFFIILSMWITIRKIKSTNQLKS